MKNSNFWIGFGVVSAFLLGFVYYNNKTKKSTFKKEDFKAAKKEYQNVGNKDSVSDENSRRIQNLFAKWVELNKEWENVIEANRNSNKNGRNYDWYLLHIKPVIDELNSFGKTIRGCQLVDL